MLRVNRMPMKALSREFRHAIRALTVTTTLAASLFSIAMPGCTRNKYRCKTDTEAYYLLDQKIAESCEVGAAPYRIELDSRSRMFDPFNPDRPPMPEDDPQAHQYMRMVDGKKGYPLWEANGRTNIVENPQWWSYLPLDERGVLVLNLDDAVRTALLHSPSYQNSLEEMYLSALDVSSERFLFDSQFFGGLQSSYTADGPFRNNAATPNSSSVYSTGAFSRGRRPLSMQKQFSTGADLIVGLANTLTWQLAGPNDQSASTVLDFSLIQPLLRQGGRDVVLERLTLAERTLLANVRSFERYRRGFYLQVATGQNIDTTPRRRGGVLGGAGFSNFTGLGGGFGNLGGGGGGAGTAGVPGANGYLGLLQDQLQIANQEETVAQLTDVYLQLRDNYRELLLTIPQSQQEIPSQQLQVVQAQQRLYDFQTTLLQLQVSYQQTLDSFKATLGLPPYLCVEIRDPLLDQFRLVSQDLRDRRAELTVARATIGEDNTAILELSSVEDDPQAQDSYRVIPAGEPLTQALDALARDLVPLGQLQQTILRQDIVQIRGDIDKLRGAIPVRRKQLNRLKEIVEREKGMVCTLLPTGTLNIGFLEGEGLEKLPDELDQELDRFEKRFTDHAQTFDKLNKTLADTKVNLDKFESDRKRFSEISDGVILGSQDLIAEISEDVLALQLIQARARTEAALLPEIDIEPRDALEIARANRRDWLNNRAALVNSWRSIEFVADDLESFLDFTVSGDVQNYGDNPLNLRSSTGRLRVGLQWDAPITRLQERNNYRQILIEYQRAKRSYYQYEDAVWTTMRSSLRAIRQNQLSFEIQRFAVQTATQQISINEDLRSISETLGTNSGPTAARDATTALQDLLSTQNQLIGIFVNYEAQRRGLDLNLGTMQIDAEGLWIDPGPIRLDTVGGSIGGAVLEYGLTEGDLRIREQMSQMENQPIENAPTDGLPPSVAPNEPDIPGGAVPQVPAPVGEAFRIPDIPALMGGAQTNTMQHPAATRQLVQEASPAAFQRPIVGPQTPFGSFSSQNLPTVPVQGK
ncbi:MAG: hypothetical protein R3C53_25810 [Pirellulaceae bacterium]